MDYTVLLHAVLFFHKVGAVWHGELIYGRL